MPSIEESVAVTNIKVLGDVPAYSMGLVYQSAGHSIALALQGSERSQANLLRIGEAAVIVGVVKIMKTLTS